MNITTFSIEGPVLAARIAIPHPVESTVSPYPWDEFLSDMTGVLAEYAASPEFDDARGEMMASLANDGTCYWIRADLDVGARFLRVYASYDDDDGTVDIGVVTCSSKDVPGRLRLN